MTTGLTLLEALNLLTGISHIYIPMGISCEIFTGEILTGISREIFTGEITNGNFLLVENPCRFYAFLFSR